MSSSTTSVLTIGLSLDWFDVNYANKPGIDTNAIRTRVEGGFNDLKKVPGFVSDAYYIVPGKEGAFNEIVSKLREGHGSKPWDGVILGFGLRGDDAFTPLFEELVNLVKTLRRQSSCSLAPMLSMLRLFKGSSRICKLLRRSLIFRYVDALHGMLRSR